MKLYDAAMPGTRGARVRWILEELGIPYDLKTLDLRKDTKQPDYLEIHPHGRVPAFEIEGEAIIESAAICMQLADLHADRGLAPKVGTPERARWYQWIVYAPATLDGPLVDRLFHTMFLPPDKRRPELVERADATWKTAAPFLVKTLSKQDWLVGGAFSAADVVVGFDIALAGNMGMLEGHPALQAYLGRLMARPAFAKAFKG
ncbi:glutathione S-transferase family protein [Sandaracinus amylolyticus]|uniref:glutathione S-transferase family protein n=1 Tax=Sandaracinus amylolyticus TaxID=927083 RepID=UPI001F1C6700|nr:glutathione S-transferase family protein [Sandaracinus amylolyticus]UJR85487.1 Hypothetical protein I5071_75670 [Sandaracinus amylolyticus]